MAELNLPNIRKGGDITFRVGLEDGGVSVDWSALEEKRAFLFSDEQRLVSGECTVAVDPEDSTVLVCQYSGDDRQYAGVNSVVVRAKYRGRLKVYDKKAVNIVGRTSAATGVVVIEDPVVPVQLSVEDVSTSLLDGAIDAALAAAAEAEHAAHLIPNQVLLDCEAATAAALNAASKAPYIDETTGRWFVWDAQAGEYVDSGKTAKGDTGNGIASWSVVESQEDDGNNVVTVTFTDGTSETFNVKNGKTGNGIASIVQTVESPDDAGTNVITITMTNGTVVTFNVKNGSKGQPGAAQAAYKSVDTLPTASAATMDKIYLTPSGTTGVYNMSYTDYDGSAYSWVDLGTTAIQLSDYATKAELTQLEAEVTDLDEELITGTRTLNRIEIADGGQITFNPITLSQDGDELEIIALPNLHIVTQNDGGYAFTFGSTESKIIVGMGTASLCLRADDNTWVYGPAGDIGDDTSYNPKKVKLKYTEGKIEVYAMDILKTTYAGQKTATIYGIGSQTMSSYGKWFGTIWKFAYTHNGVTTELTDLPGYTKNELVTEVYDESEGRVPVLEEKVEQLEEGLSNIIPNYVVESTENQVKVYTKLQGNIYAWFGINHIVRTADTSYADLWRIGHNSNQAEVSGLCSYSDGVFTDLGKYLLNYAENEFAIMFYSNDFTGGAHGNERIDLDASCYVVFIVDGKEFTINELNALGRVVCGSFSYRQKSALYTMYSVTGTHELLAYHTKRTFFVPGGFVTRNYVGMVQAMTAITTYSGLFCIYKDASEKAINDGGTAFTLTHPSSTTQIGAYSNKADRTMKMYKGGLSCEMDSRYIGGDVDSYKNANVNITLWDRQNDAKYYSSMPSNVALSATSVFEFEASVRFDYRDDS